MLKLIGCRQLCWDNRAYKEQFDKTSHQGDIKSVVIFSQICDTKVRKSEVMAQAAWKTGQISDLSRCPHFLVRNGHQGVGNGGCWVASVRMERQKHGLNTALHSPSPSVPCGASGEMKESWEKCRKRRCFDLPLLLIIQSHF